MSEKLETSSKRYQSTCSSKYDNLNLCQLKTIIGSVKTICQESSSAREAQFTGFAGPQKGSFPWAASGRSLSIGRSEGVSKALFDKKTHRILGMGICGTNAGELIAEPTLAIEMGCDMSDIALTIHAHPTLSETTAFAVEMAEGTITDLLPPKKR